MHEKTPFCCPEYPCRKKFTSVSWALKHIKLHNSEHLQVACLRNLTIPSSPRRIEPTKPCELILNNDSVKDLDGYPYLEHVENIANYQSQPLPPPLPMGETYPRASEPLSNYIANPWKRDAQGCHKTNLQNNPC